MCRPTAVAGHSVTALSPAYGKIRWKSRWNCQSWRLTRVVNSNNGSCCLEGLLANGRRKRLPGTGCPSVSGFEGREFPSPRADDLITIAQYWSSFAKAWCPEWKLKLCVQKFLLGSFPEWKIVCIREVSDWRTIALDSFFETSRQLKARTPMSRHYRSV